MATTSFCLHSPYRLQFPPPARNRSSAAAVATRRSSAILTATSLILLNTASSEAFDLRMTVPDQTVEEAESSIPEHTARLREVEDLVAAESWKEAQKELRKSSALLKQDIYTIIQGKPPAERQRLRELYSQVFNGVARVDYAARDKDRVAVLEGFRSVLHTLDQLLSLL
ncbi:psbQ-like protein 3, chloroplastic [Andrographis paniculata]|uniref:psbQ-like protein 3, chloroplastic n=1 Tax=Andrographis paniculata TaxID=175694 RepID=UPI0021E767D4|nr:psbQ-like protein 3, chloroplastic [Andrographis paniculata]